MEAKNKDGEVFGFDRLKELFYRLIYLEPEEITNRIITQVRRFSGTNRSEDDDMTIIVIKYVETHPLDTVLIKKTYLHACDHYKLLSDYKLVISLMEQLTGLSKHFEKTFRMVGITPVCNHLLYGRGFSENVAIRPPNVQ